MQLGQNIEKPNNKSVCFFNIEPLERSWFIQYDGQKLANSSSHKQLLNDSFPEDWDIYVTELSQIKNTDKNDSLKKIRVCTGAMKRQD